YLLERDLERLLEVAALDQAAEAGGAGEVRALADEDEIRLRVDGEGLEPAEGGDARPVGDDARPRAVDGGDDRPHVVGCRPAATAHDVDEAVARELAEEAARVVRLLVVAAHRIREPRVRVARHPRRRNLRELLDDRAHLGRAERAVDPDDERLRML